MLRRQDAWRIGGIAALVVMLAGCSSTSGGTISVPRAAGTASPAPHASGSPTPAPVPTTTPTSQAGSPAPGLPTDPPGMGVECDAAPVSADGSAYVSIATSGNVAGTTYTEDPSQANTYSVVAYATPGGASTSAPGSTPSPTPTPTATPGQRATPSPGPATATPAPTPPGSTASPFLVTEYSGTYSITGFTGTIVGTSTPYAAKSTTGCFGLDSEQPVSETATRLHGHAVVMSADTAIGGGEPDIANPPYDPTTFDSGSLASFVIDDLTPTTGSGTFTLQNGTVGSITITGSRSYYTYTPFARRRMRT